MTKEELERDYELVGPGSSGVSEVKELITAGRGDEYVRFALARGAETKVVEGTAIQVYRDLVTHEKEWVATAIGETAQRLEKLKWALSSENRQQVADSDPITPQTEVDSQAWLAKLAENASETRAMMLQNKPEFTEELKALDTQIAEIASMVQEPFVEGQGAGKVIECGIITGKDQDREAMQRLDREAFQNLNEDARGLIGTMTGKPLIKVVEELLDEDFPELIKAFYPRVYENTGRYHSPRSSAAMMANAVAEMLRHGFGHSATAYRLLMPGLKYLRDRRMPMFFLAPDLLQAVMRTDFDDDINWTEVELPYETGILMLPKRALVHPDDGDVAMLIWSRVPAGEHPGPWLGVPSSVLANDCFVILGACMDKMIWYDSILTANVRPTMRLNNLFYREPGQPLPAIAKSTLLDADLTEKDAEFLEKMGVVVFGTILAMNARPQLVEQGKLIKRVGKAEKAREFWSPNIIGARYRFKREVPRVVGGQFVYASGREHGTHASPRMHWRRGHYRNQPVGHGRKERKTIWIEPCLIGAE